MILVKLEQTVRTYSCSVIFSEQRPMSAESCTLHTAQLNFTPGHPARTWKVDIFSTVSRATLTPTDGIGEGRMSCSSCPTCRTNRCVYLLVGLMSGAAHSWKVFLLNPASLGGGGHPAGLQGPSRGSPVRGRAAPGGSRRASVSMIMPNLLKCQPRS